MVGTRHYYRVKMSVFFVTSSGYTIDVFSLSAAVSIRRDKKEIIFFKRYIKKYASQKAIVTVAHVQYVVYAAHTGRKDLKGYTLLELVYYIYDVFKLSYVRVHWKCSLNETSKGCSRKDMYGLSV